MNEEPHQPAQMNETIMTDGGQAEHRRSIGKRQQPGKVKKQEESGQRWRN
ncbi:hypothetical protein [Paenibacillus campi]|nr:hypothetical protein [Paenibacillus sp. SGZ-1009]